MTRSKLIPVLIIGLLVVSSVGLFVVPAVSADSEETNKTMNDDAVVFNVSINRTNETVSIHGINEGNRTIETATSLLVDGRLSSENWLTLQPGEEYHKIWNFSSDLNPTTKNHSLIAGTFSDNVEFSYYREIDASANPNVKKLHIESVKVVNTSEGPAVNVTLSNPSIHLYPARVVVTTEDGLGSGVGPVVSGENRTETVHIRGDSPPHIAGEVRLYVNHMEDTNGTLDQKEFNGTIGGKTTFRDEPYVPAVWGEYEYRPGPNNTANDPDVDQNVLPSAESVTEERSPAELAAVAALGVVLIGLVRRRRR